MFGGGTLPSDLSDAIREGDELKALAALNYSLAFTGKFILPIKKGFQNELGQNLGTHRIYDKKQRKILLAAVRAYISNHAEHHNGRSFSEEINEFMKKYGWEYLKG